MGYNKPIIQGEEVDILEQLEHSILDGNITRWDAVVIKPMII